MLCCVVEDLNNTTNSMVIHINKKRDEHNKNISVLFPESMHVSAAGVHAITHLEASSGGQLSCFAGLQVP